MSDPNQINQGRDYTFRNGVPTNVRIWAVPYAWEEDGKDYSFFAQDQWTLEPGDAESGVTVQRHEHLAAGSASGRWVLRWSARPPGSEEPAALEESQPAGSASRTTCSATARPRSRPRSAGTIPRSARRRRTPSAAGIAPSTNRTWNDGDLDFNPDCDLLNPNANGECGPWSDRTFGQNIIPNRNAPDAIEGFNHQDYNWQASASLQHELRPGIGVNVGYFRTWYGGFLATDNLLVTPADYDEYCFTAPTDSRLPNSGEQLCGLYDLKPSKFGQVDNLITQQSNYGDHTRVYNGIDTTISARFPGGAQLSGGFSMGRIVEDNCVIVDSPQDARTDFCKTVPAWGSGTQLKLLGVYPLPWQLQTSVIYQNFAGIDNTPTITLTNAQIAPSLGRNLGQCGAAAVCTATVTVPLVPTGRDVRATPSAARCTVHAAVPGGHSPDPGQPRYRQPLQRQQRAEPATAVRPDISERPADHGRTPDKSGRPARLLGLNVARFLGPSSQGGGPFVFHLTATKRFRVRPNAHRRRLVRTGGLSCLHDL